jgi:hypothetical protein
LSRVTWYANRFAGDIKLTPARCARVTEGVGGHRKCPI